MKLMYTLWGDDLGDTLRSQGFRDALAAVGATRVQVSLDDADVASAELRFVHFDQPVQAIVAVWGEDESGISAAIAAVADKAFGWEVQDTVRIEPVPTPDGVRVDALVQYGLLRRPEELSHEVWLDRWQGHHTAVAIETQDTRGYIQNLVLRPVLGDGGLSALVEEHFVMAALTDPHAWYGSGGDDAKLARRLTIMIDSVTAFGAERNLDSVPTSQYNWSL